MQGHDPRITYRRKARRREVTSNPPPLGHPLEPPKEHPMTTLSQPHSRPKIWIGSLPRAAINLQILELQERRKKVRGVRREEIDAKIKVLVSLIVSAAIALPIIATALMLPSRAETPAPYVAPPDTVCMPYHDASKCV